MPVEEVNWAERVQYSTQYLKGSSVILGLFMAGFYYGIYSDMYIVKSVGVIGAGVVVRFIPLFYILKQAAVERRNPNMSERQMLPLFMGGIPYFLTVLMTFILAYPFINLTEQLQQAFCVTVVFTLIGF
jgi:hypothetical protein